MTLGFSGEVWFWRGPAPWFFITVPEAEAREIKAVERLVTYGWGMIPVVVRIGKTEYATALWPKDDAYIVPLKAAVRKAESLNEGGWVQLTLEIDAGAKMLP